LDGGNLASYARTEPDVEKYLFITDIMNHIGYDVMQLGELDLSLDKKDLNALITRAEFDVIGSNIDPRSPEDIWQEYVIKKIGGLKVGIFGELRGTLLRKEQAIQADYIANARLMVEKLQQKRCDVIICIAHVDDRNAKALPDSVAGIDIVMGGKVAGPMKKVHQVGESYYINSGDRGRFVGHMQLFLDRTRTIDSVAVSIESMETNDPEDPYVKALVDEFKVTYDAAKGKQPGKHQQPPVTKKAPASIQQSRVGSVEQLSPLRSGEAPPPKKKQVQPPIQKTPSTGAVEPRRN